VRFHHAAAELLARVVLLEGPEGSQLGPGESGKVQLRLEKPAAVMGGDRFVLRTYSPMRVLAGGRILDPAAPKAKGSHDAELSLLGELDSGDPVRMIGALASSRGASGLETGRLAMYGIDPAAGRATAEEMASSGALLSDGERYYHSETAAEYERRIFSVLEHRTGGDELVWGVDREELRDKAGLSGSPLFDWLLERGEAGGRLFFKGGRVRAGSGELELKGETKKIVEALEAFLEEEGVKFPKRADLAARAGGDAKKMTSCMHILQDSGKAIKIGDEGWMSAAAFGEMVSKVAEMIGRNGSMPVGDFKDAFGLSRKYAVPLLEYLDGNGYTVREGDARVAGPKLAEDTPKGEA
jgi:selenocysteine-specific elongation factor